MLDLDGEVSMVGAVNEQVQAEVVQIPVAQPEVGTPRTVRYFPTIRQSDRKIGDTAARRRVAELLTALERSDWQPAQTPLTIHVPYAPGRMPR